MLEGISSTPPELTQIVNPQQRRAAGVTVPYADVANQSYLARYNNEYNYWLWQQQMAYNTPAEQRRRLEEAGLNPNFNSIDGTGNASSTPTASITQAGKVNQDNGFGRTMQVLQLAQSMSSAVKNLVGSVSSYSQIPDNVQGARQLVGEILRNNRDLGLGKVEAQKIANEINRILANYDQWAYYGVDIYDGSADRGLIESSPMALNLIRRNEALDVLNTFRGTQNRAAAYKVDFLDPLTKQWLEGRNSLQDINVDWAEFEKEVAGTTKLGQLFINFLRMLMR